MLIESLVSVLIIGIIGGGILHVTARMLNAQRDAAVTNIAINELRPLIMSRTLANGVSDLCGAGTLSIQMMGSSFTVDKNGCNEESITIKDLSGTNPDATVLSPQPVVLSVGSDNVNSQVKAIVVGGKNE